MGLKVSWHGTGQVLLPSEVLDAFLLALAECLENVRRHSGRHRGARHDHRGRDDRARAGHRLGRRLRHQRHRRREARLHRVGRRPPARRRRQRPPVLGPGLGHHRRAGGARDDAAAPSRPPRRTPSASSSPARAASASKQPRRSGRVANSAHRASLGVAFLGLGAAILVGLRADLRLQLVRRALGRRRVPEADRRARVLDRAASPSWSARSSPRASSTTVCRTGCSRSSSPGSRSSVALDIIAVWDLHSIGRYATAALAAGMTLLVVVTVRGPTEILVGRRRAGRRPRRRDVPRRRRRRRCSTATGSPRR